MKNLFSKNCEPRDSTSKPKGVLSRLFRGLFAGPILGSKIPRSTAVNVEAIPYIRIYTPSQDVEMDTSNTRTIKNGKSFVEVVECPKCLIKLAITDTFQLKACGHRYCLPCIQKYITLEIAETRILISCPECAEIVHPNEIRAILDNQILYEKYEYIMLRMVLLKEPDARFCPAPHCKYAVIASECANCPRIKCENPGCNLYFCYHCKAEWHPNEICHAARYHQRLLLNPTDLSSSQDSQEDDLVACPCCQRYSLKSWSTNDSVICPCCGTKFCLKCTKEIDYYNWHYLKRSTKLWYKIWSRKTKKLWQLGIPVWVGRKLYRKYKYANKHKQNAAIVGDVFLSNGSDFCSCVTISEDRC